MAKKAAVKGARPAKRKDEPAPEAVFREVATLTVIDYNGLAPNQREELQRWLTERTTELQGPLTAIPKRYTAHYKVPAGGDGE